MVVDVATALMYGTQEHSSLFPMFGLDTMSTLGKNCTHFLLDIGIACNGVGLWGLVSMVSVGWEMALFC